MKLLLTSSGITNKSLARALRTLVPGELRIAFIPTAANTRITDKGWLVRDLWNLQKLASFFDIVDIAALRKSEWLPRLRRANVIVVGGGNTPYLAECMTKYGLKQELPQLLKSRVYVGISAGSIIVSKTIVACSEHLFAETTAPKGLGYIDFYIRPHLNSKKHWKIRNSALKKVVKRFDGDMYAIDDESAVLYVNGKINVISEGRWKKYSKK